jgi:hypothetical protein
MQVSVGAPSLNMDRLTAILRFFFMVYQVSQSRDSSVSTALGYGLDGVLGFDSWRGLGIFLFTTASRTTLGSTQPPIQWVPGDLSLVVKRPRREADHSPPSSAEVKECVELYLHSPNTPSWRGAQLNHRDNFNFIRCLRWLPEPEIGWSTLKQLTLVSFHIIT